MNRDTLKQMAVVSLFWGALWGIAEATVGYLAHLVLILPGIAGFIMFPIGFYFMTRAYKATGKPGVLFGTAAVAATIKLADFFLPAISPLKTLNPALCILMEAAVVIAVIKISRLNPAGFRWSQALAISAGWRLGYLFYTTVLFAFALSSEFVLMGLGHIFRFIVVESLVNALVITIYVQSAKAFTGEKKQAFRIRPVYGFAAVAAALLVKLIPAIV